MRKFFLLTILTLGSISIFAQEFEELMKVVAEDRDVEDRFGWSVDIHNDIAIVGAYANDFGEFDPNMGSAYIYEKTGGEWIQIQQLTNSDQEDYDRFGWSVAIYEDLIVVGAYGEDEDELGDNSMSKAGSAYIFERNEDGEFIEVQKIVAGDRAADDEFGWSVAVHGTTVIVGAHIDDKDEFGMGSFYHAGSVYIFDRDGDGIWSQTQKIVAPDRTDGTVYDPEHEDWNDRFGESLGIWNDFIVIGAPFASKAYVFERSAEVWSNVEYLTYPGISWIDRAGSSVAIDSVTIVIGAQTEDLNGDGAESILNSGGAMIYKRIAPETWILHQKISPMDRDAGDHFGYSVAIFEDYVVVGTHSDDHDEFGADEISNTGSVYVFQEQDDDSYLEVKKLDASDRAADDELGISVAIHGNTIVSGAFQQSELPGGGDYLEDAGAAYFYTTDPDDPGDGCVTVMTDQVIEICFGEAYEIGDSVYVADGTYTNTLANVLGCDSIVTTELSIRAAIIGATDTIICAGGTYVVGDSVYDVSGEYTNVLTSIEGCDSTVTTNLTVRDFIESSTDYNICSGESINIGESVYSTTGVYVDILTSESGCDSTVTSNLTVADPINTSINISGITLSATATGMEYQWINCEGGVIIDGATDIAYTPTENGTYAVIISSGECSDTSDCYTISSVGIEDNFKPSSIQIYPVPNNGEFTLAGSGLAGSTVRIYNVLGELVYESVILSDTSKIKLENAQTGIHLIQIINKKEISTQKILIRR